MEQPGLNHRHRDKNGETLVPTDEEARERAEEALKHADEARQRADEALKHAEAEIEGLRAELASQRQRGGEPGRR